MDKEKLPPKQIVIDTLREVPLDNRLIIDLLLALLDDWEIRAEVVKNMQKNHSRSVNSTTIEVNQNGHNQEKKSN